MAFVAHTYAQNDEWTQYCVIHSTLAVPTIPSVVFCLMFACHSYSFNFPIILPCLEIRWQLFQNYLVCTTWRDNNCSTIVYSTCYQCQEFWLHNCQNFVSLSPTGSVLILRTGIWYPKHINDGKLEVQPHQTSKRWIRIVAWVEMTAMVAWIPQSIMTMLLIWEMLYYCMQQWECLLLWDIVLWAIAPVAP